MKVDDVLAVPGPQQIATQNELCINTLYECVRSVRSLVLFLSQA